MDSCRTPLWGINATQSCAYAFREDEGLAHQKQNKDAIAKRLSRLAGQVQGVSRMVEEDRYCVDILNQTAAIRSALRAVERLIIEDHARTCMEEAIVAGDQDRQRIMFQEVVGLLEKVRD